MSDKQVISERRARGAVVSGRILVVLLASMALALIAMLVLLGYFYDTHGLGFRPT